MTSLSSQLLYINHILVYKMQVERYVHGLSRHSKHIHVFCKILHGKHPRKMKQSRYTFDLNKKEEYMQLKGLVVLFYLGQLRKRVPLMVYEGVLEYFESKQSEFPWSRFSEMSAKILARNDPSESIIYIQAETEQALVSVPFLRSNTPSHERVFRLHRPGTCLLDGVKGPGSFLVNNRRTLSKK